jgi:hypothetical protein
MPDPRIPEDAPPPRRRGGRKRGRRSAGAGAPIPPTPASAAPPAAPERDEAAALSPPQPEIRTAPEAAPAPGADDARAAPVTAPGDAGIAEAAAALDAAERAPDAAGIPAEEDAVPEVAEEGTAGAPDELPPPDVPTADDASAPEAAPPPGTLERGLATILGGPPVAGRPTWLDVPPERVGPLLAVFADEGARLLAMTVLPPTEPADAPPATLDLRYHFVVSDTPITVSTHTARRSAPSAAGLFPAMTWRERELAGEHGLRFVEPVMAVTEPEEPGAGVGGQGSASDEPHPAAAIPDPDPDPQSPTFTPHPPTPADG